MPRPRPPRLHRQRTRHGKTVWYVRDGHGPRVRLRAEFGSPEFEAEYQAAISGQALQHSKKAAAVGSLMWLFDRYRETIAWSGLSLATRRQRENIMSGVLAQAGYESATAIKRANIVAGRDRRAGTPDQARHFLDTMRGLVPVGARRWPRQGRSDGRRKNPTRPKGGGFPVWTEDEVARYEARWPIGTKERVWLDVLAYTGLRRGDAVQLGRQHVRDGVATIRTEKTGVTVTIPILPALAATLAAGPCGELAFICGDARKPLTKESFGNLFRDACRAAGVTKSAHGVRKIGATRAAENGATVAELEAIFGWQGGGMAALYTRAADRSRFAKGAMSKLGRERASEHSIPSPNL